MSASYKGSVTEWHVCRGCGDSQLRIFASVQQYDHGAHISEDGFDLSECVGTVTHAVLLRCGSCSAMYWAGDHPEITDGEAVIPSPPMRRP